MYLEMFIALGIQRGVEPSSREVSDTSDGNHII